VGTVSGRKKKPLSVPVIIVHSNALFRAGLIHILSGRFRIIVNCSALSEIPDQVIGDKDCVALVGIGEEPGSALAEIESLKRQHQGLRVILVSDRLHANHFIAAISSGADGYLLEDDISADVLLRSLELVLVNGVVVPQGFLNLLTSKPEPHSNAGRLQPISATESESPQVASEMPRADNRRLLSDRERLILALLTKGASNKHIARELAIAEATVKVHVKSLLRKIRVTNRTQAAMWAMSHNRLNGQRDTNE
jgi:two-component system, NarL family, nitrate/nitrite response regulator NarL